MAIRFFNALGIIKLASHQKMRYPERPAPENTPASDTTEAAPAALPLAEPGAE
jgi:hypothetical protein